MFEQNVQHSWSTGCINLATLISSGPGIFPIIYSVLSDETIYTGGLELGVGVGIVL